MAPKKTSMVQGHHGDLTMYKEDMQTRLVSLPLPDSFNCTDPHCSNIAHSNERDNHVLDILCAIVESTHTKLPLAGGRRAIPAGRKSNKTVGGKIPG